MTVESTAPTAVATLALSADTGASSTDFITRTAAQTLSGTSGSNLLSGETVEISLDGGNTWTPATTSTGSNTWLLGGVTLAASGTIKTRVIDTAGNTSEVLTQTYVLDQAAPAAPATPDLAAASDNGSSSTDNITSIAAGTYTGTAEAGSTVTLYDSDGSTVLGTALAIGGNWSISSGPLSVGTHTLTAKATDPAGNVSGASTALNVTVESTDTAAPPPPLAPSTPDLAAGSDSGSSSTDNLTKVTAGTYTGTAEAGATVTLYDTGGSTVLGTATATGGNWSITSSALSEGVHTLTAKASSANGTSLASASLTVTVDTTAPTATIATMALSADTGSSASDFITKTAAQTISGTTSANLLTGESVEVSIDNGSSWTTAASSVGANSWSLTGVTLAASDTLKVRVTDAAGNASAAGSKAYVLDQTAPAAPSAPDLLTGSDSGSSDTDNITKVATGTFSGTAEAGASVTLYDSDGTTVLGTATATGGSWAITSSALGEGKHTLTAKATDAAGNTSPASTSLSVTVDTTAPTTTIASLAFSDDTGVSASDFNTTAAAQTISGTTSANLAVGQSVEVSIDNGNTWASASSSVGANTWALAGVTLTGSDTLKVRVTDAAGNTGTVASQAYVLDQATHGAPSTPDLDAASDSGSSNSDNITKLTTPSFSGTAEADSTVTLYDSDGTTVLGTATATGGNWSITSSTLGEGAHTLTAKATTIAGTSPASAGLKITVDTTAPTATIATTAFSADTGSSSTDFITKTAAQTISGTTSANLVSGESVEVSIDNGSSWTTAASSVGANSWSLAGVTLTGSSTLKVRVVDAAGNTGTAISQAYVLDTTAPAAPGAPDLLMANDSGNSSSDDITSVTTGSFSGTAEAGAEVTLYDSDGSTVLGTATAAGGSWSITSSTLGEGSHTLTAKARDAAGNLSPASTGLTLVIDTTAPTTTIATSAFSADTGTSSTDFITKTAAQTISGTTSANLVAGEIVEVSIDNGASWAGAVSSVGAKGWSLSGVTLSASDTLKVRLTDAAGNAGTAISQAYVLDQNAPATPSVPDLAAANDSGSSSSDNITSVTVGPYSGTADAGSMVTLYDSDGTTVLGTATATGGSWSITSSALAEGTHTLTVKASDIAGNASAASSSLSVTVDTTAPTATIATMAFSADTGASSTDFNTTTAAQTISGTTSANMVAGETVEVSMDNGSTWATATSSVGSNTWSLAGVTLTSSDTMKVRVVDSAGNIGTVASQAYVLDTTPVPTTYTLTAGNDTVAGGGADDTINGTVAGAFASGDSIDGGGGNDSLTVTDSANLSTAGATVVNVETASLTSSGTVSATTTGWTGLNTLAISAVGAVTVSSGATAIGITETGAGQLTSNIVADGGSTLTVTSSHQGVGLITIGATTAPTGTVTVSTSADAGQTGGAISVTGGSTVSVTQTATHATGTTVTAESTVTVKGSASTTAVTVTQPPVQAAATAVTGVTGVGAVTAVTAAPGTQGVTGVTGVTAVTAVSAAAGVAANGAVSITDANYNTASANTISTVTLSSYGAGSYIRGNALSTLSLAGTAGTLAITNATNGAGAVPTANKTLGLTLNGLSGVSNTITDTNNEITTLNVTTTGADSTLAAFADTGLTTLTVAGSQVLRLNSLNTGLTSITVSGSAGFNDGGTTAAGGFAALGSGLALTTTSSGPINISIDATTQTFTGSTGVDTIRISSRVDATKAVTGGSSSSDELILEGGAYNLSAATGLKVTGFETLGISANVTGTIDMSNLASGFTKFHIIGNSTVAFTKATNNANLQIDKASTQATIVNADNTGPNDTVNVSLGTATTDNVNFGTLIFKDASAVGIGTVNLVSNGVDITPGDAVPNFNTTVINDNGLSTLNISGTQGLRITTLNQTTTQSTTVTINNTNTGSSGVTIAQLTNSKLTSLNFTGTGSTKITTLTDSLATSLAIDNSGSKMATVAAMTSTSNLSSLTLTGNVQIGDGLAAGTGMTLTNTNGLTIDGSTDPAHVKLTLAGAGSGVTDNITLGNGNNVVTNVSIAGTVNLTLGTGSNYVSLGGATTNTTGRYNLTLDAGSAPDYITVGTGGTTYATTPNYVITGIQAGDRISFSADIASSSASLSRTTPGASVAQTITAVESAAAFSHGVAYAIFGGNTYLAQSASGVLSATDTTIIQLMGVHDFTASTGYVTVS